MAESRDRTIIMDNAKVVEVRNAAWNAAVDYVKNRIANGKEASPSIGNVHAGIMVAVVNEAESLLPAEFTAKERDLYLFHALAEVENGSALRQKMEKEGVIVKGNKTAALAEEFL